MKLNDSDKQILTSLGYEESAFKAIEAATETILYTLCTTPIKPEAAASILGRTSWLAGVARATLKGSAVREVENGQRMYFSIVATQDDGVIQEGEGNDG